MKLKIHAVMPPVTVFGQPRLPPMVALTGSPVDVRAAAELLGMEVEIRLVRSAPEPQKGVRGHLRRVSLTTGITVAEILGPSRRADIVQARAMVCWLCRQDGMSYPRIGRELGRDHSSIINLVRREERRRAAAEGDGDEQ